MFKVTLAGILLLILMASGSMAREGGNGSDTAELEIYTPGLFSFTWANDFLYKTDYYYSNGFEFILDAKFMEKSPFNIILLPQSSNSQVWYGLTLVQDFFTPVDIYADTIQYGDRPYASLLMIGNRKLSQDLSRRLDIYSEIRIGLIGRYSGGQYIQNGIHWILWTSRPAGGWDNQLSMDLCINYLAGIRKELLNFKYISFVGSMDARAGIPYTDITPGLEIKLGWFNDPYLNRGRRNDGWEVYLSGSGYGRFVLYNATIQGGLLNKNSPYTTNINNLVYGYKTGLTASYKLFRIDIDHHWISPEFVGGMNHQWASLRFSFGF